MVASAHRLDTAVWRVALNGVWRTVTAVQDQHVVTLRDHGQTWRLTLHDPLAGDDEAEDAGDRLVAPIPGLVTQVMVTAGDTVTRGQVVVVLEAMKTVFRLAAPADTVVAAVTCAAGEMVQEGQILVRFGDTEAAA
jgi:3-methylcrotonyl-CoA carboxylase alpha subunit